MDKIPGDIIYIVLTLIVVLFSALKKKKASQKPVSTAPNREGSGPMGEVFPTLKDLFNESEEEQLPYTQPEEAFQPKEKEEKTPGSPGGPFVKSDYVFSASSSVDDPRRQRKIQKKKIDEASLRTPVVEEDLYGMEHFDLRKAIVYSEILKRPDF